MPDVLDGFGSSQRRSRPGTIDTRITSGRCTGLNPLIPTPHS